jgi:sialate O-acetylesterase
MIELNRVSLFALLVVSMHLTAQAEVRLPHVIADNMVLQRDMPIRLWGWADAGEHVTVTLADHTATCIAADDGTWKATLPKLSAGGPHTLTVVGTNKLEVANVLIGEVWVCSGQSNMSWVMVHKTTDFDAEIAAADHPQIRLFTAPEKSTDQPADDIESQWYVCSPKTVGYFSAVAYYFGRELHKELNVPVGLVVSAVPGTRIEDWTADEGIAAVPELKDQQQFGNGRLFRGMIHPLLPMSMRGVIWYQGEGNVGDGFLYYHRMRGLVAGWRQLWQLGDFPFYYVQIAPLNWGGKPVDQQAEIWEAQTAALAIANTGMAITNDIVHHVSDAHPRNKRDVGKRLALWALNKTYGKSDVKYSGPLYKSMQVEGDKIRIAFDYAKGLTARDGKPLNWFTIAGADNKFVPAEATIENDTVLVHANEVPRPQHVRFAWHQIAQPNLMNAAGLPAGAFRTDGPMQNTQ